MYNIKKIFRKKSHIIIIVVFAIMILSLIFLFKYIFVIEEDIEKNIYNNYQNREIIVYDNSEDKINKIKSLDNILFIYNDFNLLEINSSMLGKFKIIPLLKDDMPALLIGDYPKKNNEILLPFYTIINNRKINLEDYINKEITFTLNNENEVRLIITGIFEVTDSPFVAYYNLKNINTLLEINDNNTTENIRVIIDNYKNVDKVVKKIGSESNLNNTSRLEEVQTYKALFNLALLITVIIIFFITIILIIFSSILYHETKNDRFIQFALGYNNNLLTKNYINYLLKIILISFIISIIGYVILTLAFNQYNYNNIILNKLFDISFEYKLFLPIILLFTLIILFIYIFVRIKLSKQTLYNE